MKKKHVNVDEIPYQNFIKKTLTYIHTLCMLPATKKSLEPPEKELSYD